MCVPCVYTPIHLFLLLFLFIRFARLISFTRTHTQTHNNIYPFVSFYFHSVWMVVFVWVRACVQIPSNAIYAQTTLLSHRTVCLAFIHTHFQYYFNRMRLLDHFMLPVCTNILRETQRTHSHFACVCGSLFNSCFRDCIGKWERESSVHAIVFVCMHVCAFVDSSTSLNHVTFWLRRTEREKKHNKQRTVLCRCCCYYYYYCLCCRCRRHVIVVFWFSK